MSAYFAKEGNNMMKKVLAFLLVLPLALGTVAMTAAAAATGNQYEVGYAKADINPYWQEWVDWSKNKTITDEKMGTVGDPIPGAGQIPTFSDFTYDAYDMMPLPMGGYGNNSTRLSRAKLVDDNGSGVGAGTTKVTSSDSKTYYYKTGTSSYSKVTSSNFYTRTGIYTRSGFISYKYTKVTGYQDVHLDDNRYTKDFATKLFGGDEDKIAAYKTKANITSDSDWGENDGDGVWATCVLVKDPQSNSPLLMITVDNISVDVSIIELIKDAILEKPAIKSIGLTHDRILITANHTHGSVALTTSYSSTNTSATHKLAEGTFKYEGEGNVIFSEQQLYLYMNFYKNYFINQLAGAAVEAVEDLEIAQTMEKGTIDVSQQTDYQLNGVRHKVQTYDGSAFDHGEEITYVRGSSFNNHMDDTASSTGYDPSSGSGFSGARPVTESDDNMNILQFTFKNKEPIVMVNFRAHSTANNKEAAKMLHYNISADWISPLRYQLENAKTLGLGDSNYRFTLLYGNSGNLGTGATNATSIIPHDYANYNTTKKRWEMPATPYGIALADAALALLGDMEEKNDSIVRAMEEVDMGKIRTLRTDYSLVKQQWSKLQYAAALQFYADGLKAEGGESYTFEDGQTISYTTSSGKTYSVTLGEGEGGTYVIASDYHAKNVKAKYESTAFVTIELNAIHLGDEVAFITSPIEASDRYFTVPEGMSTSNIPEGITLNDWNDLIGETWGTPFDLSLTNGSSGYVPNQLAYDYNNDYTGTNYQVAVGSYESHTTWADRGQGENIVATLNTMLREAAPRQAYCEACGSMQTWQPFSASIYTRKSDTQYDLDSSGHYYLVTDYGYNHQAKISSGVTLCLDLNGKTYSAEVSAAASRAYTVYGTLNVQDTTEEKAGKIQGLGVQWKTHTGFSAGTISIGSSGIVNLYSGNLAMNQVPNAGPFHGGVLSVDGTFNMYGGNVYGGIADNGLTEEAEVVKLTGGNIYISNGTFNMMGGKVYGGKAIYAGGNIYVHGGTVNLTGGAVEGGEARLGGGIYTAGGTLNINGASVTGGTAEDGGSLYVAGGTVKLLSGTVGGGTATNGGGVYLAKAATFTGGTITGGNATNGGSLYVAGISQTLKGTNISGGNATNGGSVFLPAGATLATTGTTVIANGEATNGGCVYLDGGRFDLASGAKVMGGKATDGGCIYYAGGNLNLAGSMAKISGGKAKNGGNLYVSDNVVYALNKGTITDGNATNCGGNVYISAKGSVTMESGVLTGGVSTGNGGNVYTEGSFTLAGGSISGGSAAYGGNIHVQNDTSLFTMKGGVVTGGTGSTNICTSQSTRSNTRLEGGKVEGTVFVQGNLTLTGVTDGVMNITMKAPAERLTIEGIYIGQVNLTIKDGAWGAGDKIGNAVDGADISGAQITVVGAEATQYVEVVGEELRMGGKATTGISINADSVKKTYKLGEELNTTGLVVNRVYSDGSTEVIADGYSFGGYDLMVSGVQTVTVTYGNFEATFEVLVIEITGIVIRTQPDKTGYYIGDELNTSGLTLTASYSDGSTEVITEGFQVSGFDSSNVGVKTLAVEYKGFSETFEVDVTERIYAYYVNDIGYDDLTAAMEASSNQYPVELNADVTDMVLSKDLFLDLRGHHVTGVTTGGYALMVFDSATDDYVGENYGTVPASANAQAAAGYLAVTEGEVTSFHKYRLEMTSLVVNTSEEVRGITYKSIFRGDAMVQSQIKEFGVAMGAYEAPDETSIWFDRDCKAHVARDNSYWKTGDNDNLLKSVYVKNIISNELTSESNQSRSQIPVYGRAYIQLTDGTMLLSDAVGFSMQDAMKQMDDYWNEADESGDAYLSDSAKEKLLAFYETYESFMKNWELPNIQATANVG